MLHEAITLEGKIKKYGDGEPESAGSSDKMYEVRQKATHLRKELSRIEAAAKAPEEGAWFDAIIKSCCDGIRYEEIDQAIMPTSNRNAFFRARRQFFWELSQREYANL